MDSKYRKVGRAIITPLKLGGAALREAEENYSKYSGLNFWNDLEYYLKTGYVICFPNLFAMFRPIDRDGKRGWFVQYACGELGELILHIPTKLDFIAWCRNNDDSMRIVDYDSFVKRVAKLYGYKEET